MRKRRQYPSRDDAIIHLRAIGKLEYAGQGNPYRIYTLMLLGGIKYILFVYEDGLVVLAYEVLRRE